MAARVRAQIPAALLERLRSICAPLDGAVEESAWVGVRWRVRKRTFAHVLTIDGGWPPAYARAASSDGPLTVVTFRSAGPLYDALCASGPPFFQPRWGITWGTKVVGFAFAGGKRVDWKRLRALLIDSHSLLAPKRKTRRRSSSASVD